MDLVEKLEKRAKELDPFRTNFYNVQVADDRELLEQAVQRIRALERQPVKDSHVL